FTALRRRARQAHFPCSLAARTADAWLRAAGRCRLGISGQLDAPAWGRVEAATSPFRALALVRETRPMKYSGFGGSPYPSFQRVCESHSRTDGRAKIARA